MPTSGLKVVKAEIVKVVVNDESSESEISDAQILGNALEYVEDPKPGQKKPTPSPGSGIRVFYETLLLQNPESFIALKWCVEQGVYPGDWEPKRANVILEKKKKYMKLHGELPSAPPAKKSRKTKPKSNIIDSTAISGELSDLGTGGWEAAGRTEL